MVEVKEKLVVVDIQFLLGVLLLRDTKHEAINVLISLSYVAEIKGKLWQDH
jgi:hypothetical protein